MSNIYIQEPPTSGKVLIKTSAGDIDIELWCREAPKTCRNFIQLCMEGYYNGTIFHRVVKGFIAQGGDPNGDGTGGESIYGAPFKDEFHSRLRFTRRGLVASANAGRDDNASQFFFTLGEAPELQNQHTIFGKVTGDTIYNMIKLEEGLVDQNERPFYPHKILKATVLLNPFDDIQPRQTKKEKEGKDKKKAKEKGVKNFGLLSFGEEAEEDEEETDTFVQKNAGKPKSTHDILDDPKLSKQTATIIKQEVENDNDMGEDESSDHKSKSKQKVDEIRNKLKSKTKVKKDVVEEEKKEEEVVHASDSDSDEYTNELEKERKLKRQKKVDEIREEIKSFKKEYKKDRKAKDDEVEIATQKEEPKEPSNEMVQQYISEQRKYSHLKKDLPKKGAEREQHTLELLNKFKSKLENVKESTSTSEKKPVKHVNDNDDDDIRGDDWLSHTLSFQEQGAILAKDASTKNDDWYDVYDPRNSLNKRKRGEEKGHHKSDHRRDRK